MAPAAAAVASIRPAATAAPGGAGEASLVGGWLLGRLGGELETTTRYIDIFLIDGKNYFKTLGLMKTHLRHFQQGISFKLRVVHTRPLINELYCIQVL